MAVRTQVYLNDFQLAQLKSRADATKTSVSDLIRQGVDILLGNANRSKRTKRADPLLSMIGAVSGGKKDSVSIDETVYGR